MKLILLITAMGFFAAAIAATVTLPGGYKPKPFSFAADIGSVGTAS